MKAFLWALCLGVVIGLPAWGAAEEICEVRAVNGGLACVGPDGERRWEIHHPSLWDDEEQYLTGELERFPIGPVIEEGRVFYAVRGDLLEVDPDAGKVIGRIRLPALIADVYGLGGSIQVVVGMAPEWPLGADTVYREIGLHLSRPLRSFSVWYGDGGTDVRFAARRDAEWLMERLEADGKDVVEGLVRAWEADPTNLVLLAELMEARGDLGRDDGEFSRQWTEALAQRFTAGPPWQDLILVSWYVSEGDMETGEAMFRRGKEQMLAAGVQPERITGLPSFVLLHMDGRKLIRKHLQAGNAEEVDRLAERMAVLTPLVEGGEVVWPALADWLESEGVDGQKWRERAEYNRLHAKSFSGEPARVADRWIAILVGTALALLLGAFSAGLIGGRRRKRLMSGGVRVRDLLGILVLLGVFQVGMMGLSAQMQVVGMMAGAPLGLFDDTLAAPGVYEWLGDQGQYGGATEFEHLQNLVWDDRLSMRLMGTMRMDRERVAETLYSALRADAWGYQWHLMKSASVSNPVALAGEVDSVWADEHQISILWWFPALIVLMGVGSFGMVAGRYLPGLGKVFSWVVPGAAKSLGPVGPVVMAMAMAAIAAFLGADSILAKIAQPAFPLYFGLDDLVGWMEVNPERGWAVACLVAAMVVQGAAVAWEIRSDGAGED